MRTKHGDRNLPARLEPQAFTPVTLVAPGDLESFRTVRQGIVALTDGWGKGPTAAVLRGGANAQAALEFLSQSGISRLDIYHLEERLPQLEEVFLSSVVNRAHELFSEVCVHWRHEANVSELVGAIGGQYGGLVFGAPLATSEIMPFLEAVRAQYSGGVAIVRGPVSEIEFAEGDEIYKWVRQRTFEGSDFSLPSVLLDWKARRKLKVAVILPSLDEAKTVGDVIATALEVKEIGLVDEVILVDSDSTDQTVEIARSYGIPVFYHRKIRPDLGSHRGKGEAMFKSAFVTNADVLVWVDTDISSITPRFFYGLLGPILTCPEVQFVKGYFSRPVSVDPSGLELGGGRVTEIMMRPWISSFMPRLSGFIQPLAGTVAIARPLLERMRIPTTYGVEIAMLMQAVDFAGLAATAQVNLGQVIHRSKDTEALGEMSFQILQVLSQLAGKGAPPVASDVLRRVFSAEGRFQIGIKRYSTYWREYERSAGGRDRSGRSLSCSKPDR